MNSSAAAHTLDKLPPFSELDASRLVAELENLLADHRTRIEAITQDPDSANWDTVVAPMEVMADELQCLFGPYAHLHNVADNDTLREAYESAVQLVSAHASEIAQNPALCACYKHIRAHPDFEQLGPARTRVIDNALRDFRLGGVDLDPDAQAQVKTLRIELAQMQTRFEQNVLDATQAYKLDIEHEERLAGLPEAVKALAAHNASERGLPGWTLTLDFPCYQPAMSHLDDRELRRTLYHAYVTRASELGPQGGQFDNRAVMRDILERRQELARLLGFENFAELSLATKMAPSTEAVTDFLYDLAERAKPAARRELEAMTSYAAEHLGLDTLENWDLAWCAEKYREHLFDLNQEVLRPYFPVDRVVAGLFEVATRLFGVSFGDVEDIDVWHPDVRFNAITDDDGEVLGYFYLDLYARDHKRPGAWMDECLVRWRQADRAQLPVAYLNCNFTPPVDGQPTLLTHDEVNTLFHEFGHGLHHLLTRIEQPAVAGINGVPWDAVELPSQFLENWCWEREALDVISGHFETGAPLPEDLFERLTLSRRYQAAMQMLRQIEFALFDFELHRDFVDGLDIQALLDRTRKAVAVIEAPPFNRFQNSFSHIFAGGYAAGYYSYKWAEVLAADAFGRFEDEGVFSSHAGQAFRSSILENGGAADAMTLFREFRGRDPQIDALLRQAGLAT